MQDIIEADDVPLWRLCTLTLRASAMLVLTVLMAENDCEADAA